jgi:hypothetical protein
MSVVEGNWTANLVIADPRMEAVQEGIQKTLTAISTADTQIIFCRHNTLADSTYHEFRLHS